MSTERLTITETGCYLDNNRGHYIFRDVVDMAEGWGFIVSPSDRFVLDHYESEGHEENYPYEVVYELCQEAEDWLNAGQDARIAGQNFPPIIPDGYWWGFNHDGDFGLYAEDEED
jgi:hypothetical protein